MTAMTSSILSLLLLLSTTLAATSTRIAPDTLATQFVLPTSTSLPFPTATLSSNETQKLLVSQWSLNKGHIQDGSQNLEFVNDPFPNQVPSGAQGVSSLAGPVLRVTYTEGSFSHDTGGAQFYSLWNTTDGSSFKTMMLSYEIAFDSNFDWVKGGKLPGLRGGLNSTGCSGGNQADGLSCFSSRLMWRTSGQGEVYAYIPTSSSLCSQNSVHCNSDFGVSIQRGSFSFVRGQWVRLTQIVQLNDPPSIPNGNIQLYFNDQLAISQSNLQIRVADTVAANGLYFSTFFGGSDASWATPVTTHTYFRNIRLWGSSNATNTSTGIAASEGSSRSVLSWSSSVTLTISVLAIIVGSALF